MRRDRKRNHRPTCNVRRNARARSRSRTLGLEPLEPRSLLDGAPLLLGPEFLVNTLTTSTQSNADVAMDAAGNYVVVWDHDDDDAGAIFARLFDSNGQPLGNQFQVNTFSDDVDNLATPAVAMDDDGDFVVAWNATGSYYYGPGSGSSSSGSYVPFSRVRAQRFDAQGVKQGSEFAVEPTPEGQYHPDVAMDANGDFVVAWDQDYDYMNYADVYFKRFSAAGAAQGGPVRVNESRPGVNVTPAVAMDEDGDFVVAFDRNSGSSSYYSQGIYARQFNALGVPLAAAEFEVDGGAMTTNEVRRPAVGMDATGDFVVAWEQEESYAGTGLFDIRARRFDSMGAPRDVPGTPGVSEFLVNTDTDDTQITPAVAMNNAGQFLIVWSGQDPGGNGTKDTYGQFYDSDGSREGGEFEINTTADGEQSNPAAAMNDNLNFVVTWDGNGDQPGQEDDEGIFAQRLTPCGTIVTNTADSGPGSLRAAIECANQAPDLDTITFAIPGPGLHTISPLSALPAITEPVIIDGYTQPGSSANSLAVGDNAVLLIELAGVNAGAAANGLVVDTHDSTIRGLVINRFSASGIRFEEDRNTVQGNFIGLDPTGTIDLGNGSHGVEIVYSDDNRVGGNLPSQRNVISGNGEAGVAIRFDHDNKIVGNYLGTDKNGTTARGNLNGIWLEEARDNTIGGDSDHGDGNIISGNQAHGIKLSESSGNSISGNYIGIDSTGLVGLGNLETGIILIDSESNNIGASGDGGSELANVISANAAQGIVLTGSQTYGNEVTYNHIGTGINGTGALGNGAQGVYLEQGASENSIALNKIAFNSIGIAANVNAGVRNEFFVNSIFSNVGLGIDLGLDGVTANDADDSDSGPNNLQNFPLLTSAVQEGADTRIQGTLHSTARTRIRIDFFTNNSGDPSGFGEGETSLTSLDVITDSSGDYVIDFVEPGLTLAGKVITATATNDRNTSEFSPGVGPAFSIHDLTVTEGDSGSQDAVFTVTLSSASLSAASVVFSTADDTANSSDYVSTSGTLTFAPGETTRTITVHVAGDSVDEPDETFFVNLSSPANASILDGQAIGTIQDNDPSPTLSIGDRSVAEGNAGTRDAVFNVTLSAPSSFTITVVVATADGTARSTDYQPFSGTLTFLPLEVSQSVTVQVTGDTQAEPNETFQINISGATNATIDAGQGIGTIIDDDARAILVTGADAGGEPRVKVYDASTSQLLYQFLAYSSNFSGGARVAVGDVNGDGTPDIITGAGPGGGPHVRVFDSITGQQLPGEIGSFFAYSPNFSGGVFVAAGDVNGDGFDDIVTGADAGGGPHVRVFSGRTGGQLAGRIGSFFAYKTEFNAGVRVAAGDVDGDGQAEVITGMGAGYEVIEEPGSLFARLSQQDVRVFAGADARLIHSFEPFEAGYRGGVHLAIGDTNGDHRAEIIVSKANGDRRTDAVFDAQYIKAFRRSEVAIFAEATGGGMSQQANFLAYPGFGGSVRVATIDQVFRDLASPPDYFGPAIVTGAGPGGGPHVKLRAKNLAVLDEFFSFNSDFLDGLWVAAGSPEGQFD